MNAIKREIELGSYWEHFKFSKDLALILPVDDPKRKHIEKVVNDINLKLTPNP